MSCNSEKELEKFISKIASLEKETDYDTIKRVYAQGIYLANELMQNWDESKKIKCLMSVGKRIAQEGIFRTNQVGSIQIRRDIYNGFTNDTPLISSAIGLCFGLEEVLKENKNPDAEYPYYNLIKGSYVVEKRAEKAVRCIIYREEIGDFVQISSASDFQLFNNNSDSRTVEVTSNIFQAVDSLIGEKVFFFSQLGQFKMDSLSGEYDFSNCEKYELLGADDAVKLKDIIIN